MLSKKVTFAIIFLNELAKIKPNKWGRRVLDNGAFLGIVGIERTLLNQILQKLHSSMLISYKSPNNITLNSDLDKVTLFDLYNIFHGGISIGEEYEHNLHKYDSNGDIKYPKIVLLEIELKNNIAAFLKRYTIASLTNEEVKTKETIL